MHCTDPLARKMIDSLAGFPFTAAAPAIRLFDWSQYWPVVDEFGRLTGAIIDSHDDYTIVDIDESGTLRSGDDCVTCDACCLTTDLPETCGD